MSESNSFSAQMALNGGKSYLADRIIALMPAHTHYVESFFGGGSVLFAKNPHGVSEVANDINKELSNFWNVLRSPTEFAALQRLLEATEFSEILFDEIGADTSGGTDIDRAWRFFVRCRQSMAGRMKGFTPITRNRTRRGMNEQASAWLTAIEGLPEVHNRLKRVVVMNKPAIEVIRQQDGPGTLHYVDPPYVHSTRATTGEYAHEMIEADHINLLGCLSEIEGKFILSGYRCPIYDNTANVYQWNRHDFDLPNNAAGGAEKRRMTECLWCNF